MTTIYGKTSATKINHSFVLNKAYLELKRCNVSDFPIDPIKIIKDSNRKILVLSYDEVAKRYTHSFSDVVDISNSAEGCTFYDPFTQKYMIWYNNRVPDHNRKKFTLLHEFGHIVLGHSKRSGKTKFSRNSLTFDDNPIFEKEANLFAAELQMPSFLVRYIPDEDISYLQDLFMISESSAKNSLTRVNRIARKYGPNLMPIPNYLHKDMHVYANAICKKEYVDLFRYSQEEGVFFNSKTGRYFQK